MYEKYFCFKEIPFCIVVTALLKVFPICIEGDLELIHPHRSIMKICFFAGHHFQDGFIGVENILFIVTITFDKYR